MNRHPSSKAPGENPLSTNGKISPTTKTKLQIGPNIWVSIKMAPNPLSVDTSLP